MLATTGYPSGLLLPAAAPPAGECNVANRLEGAFALRLDVQEPESQSAITLGMQRQHRGADLAIENNIPPAAR
jgi:hypothetical protein